MRVEKAKRTFRSTTFENQMLRAGIGASLILNMFLGYSTAVRPETVVLLPPFTASEIRFTEGKANAEYYKSWAVSTATLIGNLDPSNVNFVNAELQRIATTGLYRKLEQTIEGEMQNIVDDKAVLQFSPSSVIYDPNLDLYFVTGRQLLSGPGDVKGRSKQITYEMRFTTERLRIYLSDLQVYDGQPMTNDVRESRLAAQEAAQAAEAARKAKMKEDGR